MVRTLWDALSEIEDQQCVGLASGGTATVVISGAPPQISDAWTRRQPRWKHGQQLVRHGARHGRRCIHCVKCSKVGLTKVVHCLFLPASIHAINIAGC